MHKHVHLDLMITFLNRKTLVYKFKQELKYLSDLRFDFLFYEDNEDW